jgi:hypothetical protein
MTTGDAFDDSFDDIAGDRELASIAGAAREARRVEEEEYARAAARQWTRHRELLDVAREMQHRGDTGAVHVAERVFRGEFASVGRDYIQMSTPRGRVDIPLTTSVAPRPFLLRVVERAREGGRRAEPAALTFRARLLEYERDEIDALVGTTVNGDELRGGIVVGRDHIVVREIEGMETYVLFDHIAWIHPWRE